MLLSFNPTHLLEVAVPFLAGHTNFHGLVHQSRADDDADDLFVGCGLLALLLLILW